MGTQNQKANAQEKNTRRLPKKPPGKQIKDNDEGSYKSARRNGNLAQKRGSGERGYFSRKKSKITATKPGGGKTKFWVALEIEPPCACAAPS